MNKLCLHIFWYICHHEQLIPREFGMFITVNKLPLQRLWDVCHQVTCFIRLHFISIDLVLIIDIVYKAVMFPLPVCVSLIHTDVYCFDGLLNNPNLHKH